MMLKEPLPTRRVSRTDRRSRSGAHHPCPHCGKHLRGAKGLKMHLAAAHAVEVIGVDGGAL